MHSCTASFCTFSNSYIWQSLNRLGLKPQKSLKDVTSTFDSVPKQHVHHFVRGIFDGDGSVSIAHLNKNKNVAQPYMQFSGHESTLRRVRDLLCTECGVNFNALNLYASKGCSGSISWCGTRQVKRLFIWMYADATLFLNRKFNIFHGWYSSANRF